MTEENKNLSRAVLRSTAVAVMVFGILGYLLWVGWFALNNLEYDRRSHGISAAVDVALGLDRSFPQRAIAAHSLTNEMKEECLRIPRVAEISKKVGIGYPQFGSHYCYGINYGPEKTSAYYRRCGFWWKQDCIALSIATPLFTHKDLLEKVLQVTEAPCSYLPTVEEIKKTFGFSDLHNLHYPEDADAIFHLQDRQSLGCDSSAPVPVTKITVGVFDPQTSRHVSSFIATRKEK